MKSESKFSWLRRMVVVIGVLGAFASLAQATPSASGKFTLIADTHWGKAVLPPGNYRYSVEYSGAYPSVVVRNVESGRGVILMPHSISQADWQGKGELVLSRQSGQLFVSSFCVRELGVILYYDVASSQDPITASLSKSPVSAGSASAK